MRTIIFGIIFFLFLPTTYGQENCKVLIEEISETYEGKCKNGLAHGKGIAKGEDTYEGRFKKGLPHGKGIYIWANGNKYDGRWKEGERHGRGTFYFTNEKGAEETKKGYWKNDTLINNIRTTGYNIGHVINLERYSIKKKDEGNSVSFLFYYMGRMRQLPNDLNIRLRSGMQKTEGYAIVYEEVDFPAQILVTFSVPDKLQRGLMIRVRFEVTIEEPGDWEIKFYN